jgi:hypothetical protein
MRIAGAQRLPSALRARIARFRARQAAAITGLAPGLQKPTGAKDPQVRCRRSLGCQTMMPAPVI